MGYWREAGGAAEQGVLHEIQISFSTKKASSYSQDRTKILSKFQQKIWKNKSHVLNHFYEQ